MAAATGRPVTAAGRRGHDTRHHRPYSRYEAAGSMKMMGFNRWIVAVGVVGTMAMLAAGGLLWLVLTRPVALATFIDRLS